MNEKYNKNYMQTDEKIDFQVILSKYLSKKYWFLASLLLCLLCAWLYLRYTNPIYKVSASVLIKDDEKKGNKTNISAIDELSFLALSVNLDNEIEVLRSKSLIRNVIIESNLYTTYFAPKQAGRPELYHTSPLLVKFDLEDLAKLTSLIEIEIVIGYGNKYFDVEVKTDKKKYKASFDNLYGSLQTELGELVFSPNSELIDNKEWRIDAIISPPDLIAEDYFEKMSVVATGENSSVAYISLESTNRQRGKDFINKLVELYNRNTNKEKNEVAEKTAMFLNERLEIINNELEETEQQLELFKSKAGLSSLNNSIEIALAENADYEKKRVENGTHLNLINYLKEYINNPVNNYTALPVNIGFEKTSLPVLIDQYNELILERARLLKGASENNPLVININGDIRSMLENIRITVDNINEGLLITQRDLDREANKYYLKITDAPAQERQLMVLSRQQEIKSGLYLMLLQKREENAIALAATADKAKIIDAASAGTLPVYPRTSIIWLAAFVMGFVLPILVIALIDLFSYKIKDQAEVEKVLNSPFLGSIPCDKNIKEHGDIRISDKGNNIMTEAFRQIRTNLLFLLGVDKKKVILVTSTISGEGKTFIASNLALSLAMLNKKVVLVGLDMRKPRLNKVFELSNKGGITEYLANPAENDLLSFVQESKINENLFILPGGLIPPNPTELLERASYVKAIDILRENYDYVILDSSPVGVVTDTLVAARAIDASIYVCRIDYSYKSSLELINRLVEDQKLPNLYLVLNAVNMKKKKYGYGYGYGDNAEK